LMGLPSKLHVNTAGRPKSTVCVVGSMLAASGAATLTESQS
jgi:hypothetical protein